MRYLQNIMVFCRFMTSPSVFRFLFFVGIVLNLAVASLMLGVKMSSRQLHEQIRVRENHLHVLEAETHVLRTELHYLNRPDRLHELMKMMPGFAPLSAHQVIGKGWVEMAARVGESVYPTKLPNDHLQEMSDAHPKEHLATHTHISSSATGAHRVDESKNVSNTLSFEVLKPSKSGVSAKDEGVKPANISGDMASTRSNYSSPQGEVPTSSQGSKLQKTDGHHHLHETNHSAYTSKDHNTLASATVTKKANKLRMNRQVLDHQASGYQSLGGEMAKNAPAAGDRVTRNALPQKSPQSEARNMVEKLHAEDHSAEAPPYHSNRAKQKHLTKQEVSAITQTINNVLRAHDAEPRVVNNVAGGRIVDASTRGDTQPGVIAMQRSKKAEIVRKQKSIAAMQPPHSIKTPSMLKASSVLRTSSKLQQPHGDVVKKSNARQRHDIMHPSHEKR